MKIKKIFTRFICFAITFALILPMLPKMESYASSDTTTVLLWKESDPHLLPSSNDKETINEIITDEPNVKNYDNKSNNNWYLAHEYDHLPYNEFHNRVENDIVSKNTSKGKELTINYYDGSYGRADIFQRDDSIYLW